MFKRSVEIEKGLTSWRVESDLHQSALSRRRLKEAVDARYYKLDLSGFDVRYHNDATGAPA